jgi:hypothetical protein
MSVVAALPFVRIATPLIHVTCLAGHLRMIGVADLNGPLGHGSVIVMGMPRRRLPIHTVSSGRSLTAIAHLEFISAAVRPLALLMLAQACRRGLRRAVAEFAKPALTALT